MTNTESRAIVGAFAASSFVSKKLAISPDEAYALFGAAFKVEKGTIVGYDPDGNRLISQEKFGCSDYFDECLDILVSKYENRDHILKGTGASGGGARGSGFSSFPGYPPQPSYYTEPNPPDWSIYKHAISLSLGDVIALSCNIYEPVGYRDRNAEFVKRTKIAELRLEELQSPPIGALDKSAYRAWKYNLAEFRRWGEALGWVFPTDFPRLKNEMPVLSFSQELKAIAKNRTGPTPKKTETVIRQMLDQLRSQNMTHEDLTKMKQEHGAAIYEVARSTFDKARNKALLEFLSVSNSDK